MLSKKYSKFIEDRAKSNPEPGDYCNWYAIQTFTGQEKKIDLISDFLFKKEFEVYIPSREAIHKVKGEEYIARLPIFPGYVFIYKDIEKFINKINDFNSNIVAKPVKANGKYLKIDEREMKFLFDITGNSGVIQISKGVILKNQRVKIVKGPLKNLEGKILFINKRKNKAKVRLEIMNRVIDISLGLEIIESGSLA